MSFRSLNERVATWALIIVLAIFVASYATLSIIGNSLSAMAQRTPFPAQGLVDDVGKMIERGETGATLQDVIRKGLTEHGEILAFMVVAEGGDVIAGFPEKMVGQNTPWFHIRRSNFPNIVSLMFYPPPAGVNDAFISTFMQGHDPDSGEVDLKWFYQKGSQYKGYMMITSYLRSPGMLKQEQRIRDTLNFADGIFRISFIAYWLLLAVWVYGDARRRTVNAPVWGILTLFTNVVGWSVYMIARPKLVHCPSCQHRQDASHKVCTACGHKLKATCPECGREIDGGWDHCADCGAKL